MKLLYFFRKFKDVFRKQSNSLEVAPLYNDNRIDQVDVTLTYRGIEYKRTYNIPTRHYTDWQSIIEQFGLKP